MNAIVIESSKIRENSSVRNINGVDVHIGVSPYQLPKKFKIEYRPEDGSLVINFKYIDDEPPGNDQRLDDLVTMTLGKHSEKIVSIKLHVDKHDIGMVRMLVSDQIPSNIEKVKPVQTSKKLNFDLAAKALRAYSQKISEVAFSMA